MMEKKTLRGHFDVMLFSDEPATLHTIWALHSYLVDCSRVLGFSLMPRTAMWCHLLNGI
jgi:hypothetical protein